MRLLFRTLIILIVAGSVFGTAAYFAYELFWKEKKLDAQEKRELAQAVPTPTPDYSLPAFEKAVALQRAGSTDQARQALADFFAAYPDSSHAASAKALLGEINVGRIFSPSDATDKTPYTVSKGDSLVKIASKVKSNAELLFRANNLETINLKIGQTLLVPQIDMAITVNRAAKTVTLYNKGEFFKEYPVISLKIPAGQSKTKVSDKFALRESKRVAFGEKNYAESERCILIGQMTMRGLPVPAEGATPPPAPPGISLSQPDSEEIFLLVSRGTPVTIE